MKFIPAAKKGLTTFNATGRASQSEFWFLVLATTIISGIVGIIVGALGLSVTVGGIIRMIVSIALFVPIAYCGARRAHDCNMSGYAWFLLFIPLVGALILGLKKGDEGENQYGAVPNRE